MENKNINENRETIKDLLHVDMDNAQMQRRNCICQGKRVQRETQGLAGILAIIKQTDANLLPIRRRRKAPLQRRPRRLPAGDLDHGLLLVLVSGSGKRELERIDQNTIDRVKQPAWRVIWYLELAW